MFNQDYQNTQNFFNLGCDFRILTPTFKDIEVYPIASNHSGFYHTPRVGDEVIISFMDNDIDKPYISGSLYNTHNPSPATLT